MTTLEITQKAKLPLISCAAGSAITAPAKDRVWVFKTAQTDQMAVERIYQYLQKHNLKQVAILTVSTGFGVCGQGTAPGPGRPVRHPGGGPGGLRRKKTRT